MKKFIKERWDDIINWTIGGAGIVATVVAANSTEENGFSFLYIALLAMQSILVCFGIYTVKFKNSHESEKEKLTAELTENRQKLEDMVIVHELEMETNKKYVSTIISNLKNMSKLNNDLYNRILNYIFIMGK